MQASKQASKQIPDGRLLLHLGTEDGALDHVQQVIIFPFTTGKCQFLSHNRLVGLLVKASTSGTADLGSIPAFAVDLFHMSSHSIDIEIGTPVASLPGAWTYRARAGTGWSGVSVP